jgi:hypothetical protein
MRMTLNYIENVEDQSNEDTPIYIYMDKMLDMIITCKDTNNARHVRCLFHAMKQGLQYEWHTPVWISNQCMVADGMTKVLAINDLIHKIQYMLTIIDTEEED